MHVFCKGKVDHPKIWGIVLYMLLSKRLMRTLCGARKRSIW